MACAGLLRCCPTDAMCACAVQLIYLQQMALLLVRMKRTELRVKAKRRAAAAANTTGPAGGNGTISGGGDAAAPAAAGPKLD